MIKIMNAYYINNPDKENNIYIQENEIINIETNKETIEGKLISIGEINLKLDCSKNYTSKIITIKLTDILNIYKSYYIEMEDIKKPTNMKGK